MNLVAKLALGALLMVLLEGPGLVQGAWCNTKSNQSSPMNNHTIDLSAPVFVKNVTNGELYTVGNAENRIHLLHLYGKNGYDFGFAAGQLLGDMAKHTLDNAWAYFKAQILQAINGTGIPAKLNLPPWLVKRISTLGLELALDLQNAESAPFINYNIYDEMRGLSDATGIDYNQIVRIHLIGEITRGSCSLYGAFKSATLNGKTLQLRALDWDLGAGLQDFPTVTIYHPADPSLGVPFANVGWAGWIGVLTGMSSNKLGISEIGVSYPDDTFGDETFVGIPFIFLERQIVQYGTSVFNAMDMIKNANRTCRLILGVADGNARTARMVQYSHSIVRFFDPEDLEPLAWWHPRLNDTVYNGMDWVCPYYQHLMYRQLSALHGRLTPENTASNVTAVVGTGDLHIGIFDLTDDVLFVANARGANQTGGRRAYQRQFIRLNLTDHYWKPYGQF
jgi:isopenicillin-N N-acyltransferase-like protein